MATNTVKVKVQKRTETGTRAMKRLRGQGNVPGVIYGHKKDVVPVTMNTRELARELNRGAHVFELDVDGTTETVLVKEAQYDHLGIELIHVDFARVSLDEKVEVTVPLELRGKPAGEEEGGKLQQLVAELEIECRVLEIPEFVRHDVSGMGMDSVLHIKDIKLPENVTCLQDGDLIVAMVREVKEEAEAAVEAVAAAEPEVIGAKEREEKAAETGAAEKEKK